MNARLAIEVNENLTTDLLNSSKEMATRLNITIEEAIDKKVAVYVKYSKNNSEAAAWNIRCEEVKKLLSA